MSTSNNDVSVLFLQGGPGLSSQFERSQLGDIATVDWWDPPFLTAPSSAPSALTRLYAAVEAKFDAMRARRDGPIHLLSSSFGCHLALHLIRRSGPGVASLTMLAPSLDIPACYLRLARHLHQQHPQPALRAAIEGFEAQVDLPNFWTLAGAVMTVPDFARSYWSGKARKQGEQFATLLADAATFHPPSFQAILNDFLAHPRPPGLLEYTGPVTAIFGDADPLIDATEGGRLVHQYLPAARLRTVAAGHFPHLECAPALWLPECAATP
ncbi:MAG: alpha/beta hydrolase [Pseudomonadota bacterium]